MELYVPEKIAESIIRISESFNIDAKVIGYCRYSFDKKVIIQSEFGEYSY
jgi:phosphoribosylformylglycinamidine cyclo-ligase